MMKNRTANFYNVLTGTLSLLNRPDSYFLDPETPNFKQSPRWFTKESNPSFYEPRILVSGPHNRNKDVRTDISVGEDTIVFGDSGGFQLATGKISPKEWTCETSLSWLEKNANIFPILDWPIGGLNKELTGKVTFNDAVAHTREAAKYFHDKRTRDDRTIMNVLSASRASHMQPWYDEVKEYKLDGWAFGAHYNHLKTILEGIMFLVNNDEFNSDVARPLHVFGTTSMGVIPYIVYAQHLLNEKNINIQLSFDSSSASAMVNYGNYIQFCTPTAMTNTGVSNKYDWTKLTPNSRFGCSCPICRDVDDMKFLMSEEGKGQFYMIIATHNYYQMLQYKRTFDGIVSLNCQEVNDSLPLELKENFKIMKKAFDIMGEGGLSILSNGIKVQRKKNPTANSGKGKGVANFL